MRQLTEQHKGDLIVDGVLEVFGQVAGTTYVLAGGKLFSRGQLSGGLIIEQGGLAIVHGQVSRNVVNHGTLELLGQVVGKVVGNPPINDVQPAQIIGTDLEVPFRGETISWSYTQ